MQGEKVAMRDAVSMTADPASARCSQIWTLFIYCPSTELSPRVEAIWRGCKCVGNGRISRVESERWKRQKTKLKLETAKLSRQALGQERGLDDAVIEPRKAKATLVTQVHTTSVSVLPMA